MRRVTARSGVMDNGMLVSPGEIIARAAATVPERLPGDPPADASSRAQRGDGDTIVIAPDDLGNTGLTPVPALPSPNRTITVSIGAVNDTPIIVPPAVTSVNEDAPAGLTLTGFQVNDVDISEGTGVARVALAVTNGRIKLRQLTGVTITNGP